MDCKNAMFETKSSVMQQQQLLQRVKENFYCSTIFEEHTREKNFFYKMYKILLQFVQEKNCTANNVCRTWYLQSARNGYSEKRITE